jgi:hypothetical protein
VSVHQGTEWKKRRKWRGRKARKAGKKKEEKRTGTDSSTLGGVDMRAVEELAESVVKESMEWAGPKQGESQFSAVSTISKRETAAKHAHSSAFRILQTRRT